MIEIILVKNRPYLNKMIESGNYKIMGSVQEKTILEDFSGNKAFCTIGENDQLEYIYDYLHHNCLGFVANLERRLNVFWIHESDLLDYNQFAIQPEIPFAEFQQRLAQVGKSENFIITYLEQSDALWDNMSSICKARVLPVGYLKNYIRAIKTNGVPRLNVIELFHNSIDGILEFGIPNYSRMTDSQISRRSE